MSAPNPPPAGSRIAKGDVSARGAITFYNPHEEREADKAPLQARLIRRIFQYTKPYAAKRNWLFLLTFLRGLQLPALAWLIGRTINGPIAGRDVTGIYWSAAGYFTLALVTVGSFHFRQRFALELGEAVVHDMRLELVRKLMTMPMAFFNTTKFGRIISRMTSDIDSVRTGVQDVMFVLVVQGLQMATAAALMAWYDWKLFSLMVIMAPFIWLVNKKFQSETSRRMRKTQESWSRVSSTLAESVSGIRLTQAFVRQEVNAEFFQKLIDAHGENNVVMAQTSAVFVPLLQLKSQVFLGAMALLGAFGALRWHGWLHMEPGDLVMFFFLANLFFEPVQVIGNQLNQALMAMAGAERFFRLLDQPPEWADAPGAKPLSAIQGRVEFAGVNFAYQTGRPVLEDISLAADPALKAVVSKTVELGARGRAATALGWSAAVFRTELHDDIQFISSGGGATSAGYFQNVGQTRRQGLELGLDGQGGPLRFSAHYSLIAPTFQTPLTLNSPSNSTAAALSCPTCTDIQVQPGNRIPGIPRQILKLRAELATGAGAAFGANLLAQSSQTARGDENNRDIHGPVPGFAVVNLDARYAFAPGWEVFAKVNNLFDRRYATFATLGQNVFTGPGNSFDSSGASWRNEQFRSVGAPRGVWVGVNCRFGGGA